MAIKMVNKLYEAVRSGDIGSIEANLGAGNITAALALSPNTEVYNYLASQGADEALAFSSIILRGDQGLVFHAADRLHGRNFGTWLATAARLGNNEIVGRLASEGHGLSRALRVAVMFGSSDLKTAQILVDKGASPNKSNALLYAARTGNQDLLNWLLPYSSATKINSALMAGIRGGVLKSVETLAAVTTLRIEHLDEAREHGDPSIIEFIQNRL